MRAGGPQKARTWGPPPPQGRAVQPVRSRLRPPGHRRAPSADAPLILVWDNLNTHCSGKMRAFTEAREDWLTVVQLPGYALELLLSADVREVQPLG